MKTSTILLFIVSLLITTEAISQERIYFGVMGGGGISNNYVKEIDNVPYLDKLQADEGTALFGGGIIGFTIKYGLSLELGVNRVLKNHEYEASYDDHFFHYSQSRFVTEIPFSLKFRPRLHGFSSLAFNVGPSIDIYEKDPHSEKIETRNSNENWSASVDNKTYKRMSPAVFMEAAYERNTKGYSTFHVGIMIHFLPSEIFESEYSHYEMQNGGMVLTDYSEPRSYGHYVGITFKYFIHPFLKEPFGDDPSRHYIFDKDSRGRSKNDKY